MPSTPKSNVDKSRKYKVSDLSYSKKYGELTLEFKSGERTYYGITPELAAVIKKQVKEGKTINKDLSESLKILEKKTTSPPEKIITYPVESSNVASIGYDFYENNLYVDFLSNSEYVYYDVDPQTYYRFINSGSKGKFLWRSIRDFYDYSRIA